MIAWAPLFHYSLTEAGNGVILLLLFLDIDIGSQNWLLYTQKTSHRNTQKNLQKLENLPPEEHVKGL